MKFLTILLSLIRKVFKLFVRHQSPRRKWRTKYELLRRQRDDLSDLHAKALARSNTTDVLRYYRQWMQTSRRLASHRATGKQSGYID